MGKGKHDKKNINTSSKSLSLSCLRVRVRGRLYEALLSANDILAFPVDESKRKSSRV